MKVYEIVDLCTSNGVLLSACDGALQFELTVDEFPAKLRQLVVDNKEAIIEFLSDIASSESLTSKRDIPLVPRDNPYFPLSFSQQNLWVVDKMKGSSAEYNIPLIFDITDEPERALLEQVLTDIIARHEVLRTVYVEFDGEAKQQVLEDYHFSITEHDLSALSTDEQALQLKALVEQEVLKPFDLSRDLMLRLSYFRVAGDCPGKLVFNLHHIASDGWSMAVLTREFGELYNAYSQGKDNPLPALELQYIDYAAWQRQWLEGEHKAEQLQYWQTQLADTPLLHGLPLSYERPEVKRTEGGRVDGRLSSGIANALEGLARRYDLTPFMLVHGAFSLFLSRYSNSNDIVIGTPVANRADAALEPLIGFFVNTLVLRANTSYDTLDEYFAHVRQTHLAAQDNQDIPFEQLVEQLKVPRSLSHTPLFQLMLTASSSYGIDSDKDQDPMSQLGIKPTDSSVHSAKFDLDVDIHFSPDGISLKWLYDKSLFAQDDMNRFNVQFCRLLEGLAQSGSDRHMPPAHLPLLSEDEQAYLIDELNDTARPYRTGVCIHSLFEEQSMATPNKTAVIFEEQQLSYNELNVRANQMAHYLIEQGVKTDSLVGIFSQRSIDMVVAILAVLKAGGAYVPLDAAHPTERLRYIVKDAQLSLVLSQQSLSERAEDIGASMCFIDQTQQFEHYSSENPAQGKPSGLAYVIYTSGSTGQPKGVMVEHQSLVNEIFAQKECYGFGGDEVALLLTSSAFDISNEPLFLALLDGSTLLITDEATSYNPQDIEQLLLSEGVTHINSSPSHLSMILPQTLPDSVRRIMSGGEALTSELSNRYGAKLYNAYGPTEATIASTNGKVSEQNVRCIGQALGNVTLYVLDSALQLAPYGTPGELFIGGSGLARGYLNNSELTQQRFVANPFYDASIANSTERLYQTGDLVRYIEQGKLEYLGRSDDQIKLRGFRIEPGEIEVQLSRIDGVDSAVVMVQKTQADEDVLVGFVKVKGPEFDDMDALKHLLGKTLPGYMVPQVLMSLAEWPLTVNGKIDKKALPLAQPVATKEQYVAPTGELEQSLVVVWSELLKIDGEQISRNANFFELGGTSLLCIKLLSKLKDQFDIQLTVMEVYNAPTIKHLADEIDRSVSIKNDVVEDVSNDDDFERFEL